MVVADNQKMPTEWLEGPFTVGTPEYFEFVKTTGFELIRDKLRKKRKKRFLEDSSKD